MPSPTAKFSYFTDYVLVNTSLVPFNANCSTNLIPIGTDTFLWTAWSPSCPNVTFLYSLQATRKNDSVIEVATGGLIVINLSTDGDVLQEFMPPLSYDTTLVYPPIAQSVVQNALNLYSMQFFVRDLNNDTLYLSHCDSSLDSRFINPATDLYLKQSISNTKV